ncbi:flagellar hook protein FlgE [Bacillus coahuilensis p1.1.43]|uniref:Flagellar hook protein FlgE n=1 Tax=Bacillus coahuilensis p1.1.43 TaxID=1150625 RepID=A0A147K9N9_9BACI|nr:flagellar basal-body rod protein FlgF [Bacillus coahuilensis]KUP07114.1 flagellar hook protein FlgE [Bacillus coahuilensis p1.1.43]
MLRSMYSGISGMKNAQTKLDVIGNNIANVNTYGFKKGRVTFQDLMNQTMSGATTPTENRGGQNAKQIGLGGTIASIDIISTQGSLQTTGRSLDVAISGDGYFVVRNGQNEMYTRAGNFYLDSNGSLVDGNGNLIQGYQADANGVIDYGGMTDIVIDSDSTMAPRSTSEVTFNGNLKASAPIYDATNATTQAATADGRVTVDYSVKDSLGSDIPLKVTFTKTASNSWDTTISYTDTLGATQTITGPALSFSSDGKLDPATVTTLANINLPVNNINPGAVSPQAIDIDFAQITQFDSSTSANINTINGNSEGYLESFTISSSGEINGIYSNGEVQAISQLVMATFSNAGGLLSQGGNTFTASNNSGLPNYGIANEGRGAIQSGSLEMSNVDLSEEFTEMITAQRSFQANTRIITTSDEILQELVNLKR